jgi:hypothetical protein
MSDVLEILVTEIAEQLLKGYPLTLETIEKCYLSVRDKQNISESDEQSKKWCQFIFGRFSGLDFSKRDMYKVNQDALKRELYALIAK